MNKYHEYRDSGIFWIGDIPSHWDVKKLKYLASVVLSSVDRHEHENELSVSVCHYPDVYYREFIDKRSSLPSGTCSLAEFEKFRLIKGDVILTKDSEAQDDIGVPTYVTENVDNTVCGYHLAQVRMQSMALTDLFTYRFLQSTAVKYYFCISAKGITRYALGKRFIENLFVIIPPIIEQRRISSYLDKKTEQIDSLIAKTRKKLDLLQEQRTSLIQHCVTNGPNPDAEMKDSGVDWVGEIPKHWQLKKLKYLASVELSSIDRHNNKNEISVSICHYPDVHYNEFIDRNSKLPLGTCSENEYEKFSLKKGDILLTKDSVDPRNIGIPTYIKEDLKNTVCGYGLAQVRISSEELTDMFAYRFIQSSVANDYFLMSATGVTIIHLGKGTINNLLIPVPPISEQEAITSLIDKQSSLFQQLVKKYNMRITLLKEYRQAVISSAVTGKIRITENML